MRHPACRRIPDRDRAVVYPPPAKFRYSWDILSLLREYPPAHKIHNGNDGKTQKTNPLFHQTVQDTEHYEIIKYHAKIKKQVTIIIFYVYGIPTAESDSAPATSRAGTNVPLFRRRQGHIRAPRNPDRTMPSHRRPSPD